MSALQSNTQLVQALHDTHSGPHTTSRSRHHPQHHHLQHPGDTHDYWDDSYSNGDGGLLPSGPLRRVPAEDDTPSADLLAFGLYRLSPQQQEVYDNFVQLLRDFNHEDAVCVLTVSACFYHR